MKCKLYYLDRKKTLFFEFIINTKKFKINFELIHQSKSLSEKIGDVPGTSRGCPGDAGGSAGTPRGTAGTGTSPIFSTEPLPTIECSKKIVEIKINLDQPNTALDIRIVAFFVGI